MLCNITLSVLKDLKSLLQAIKIERDRLKVALDAEIKANNGVSQNHTCGLESSLSQALQQNTELRKRLQRIYEFSDISDLSVIEPNSETVSKKEFLLREISQINFVFLSATTL